MRIVTAGGHGRVALLMQRMLVERGDSAAGIIRKPKQADDLLALGVQPLIADLENSSVEELTDFVRGADAVVFAAAAGAGRAERRQTVDRDAALLLADAAEAAGVRRYLIVSSMGADTRAVDGALDLTFRAYLRENDPFNGQDEDGRSPAFGAYLQAKGAADEALRGRSALNVTVLRPGLLSDEAGTGRVLLTASVGAGSVPREDVAAVLVALLDAPGSGGQTVELISGATPIVEAVASLSGPGD
ncbi:NAD(P)H-binding protein [Streptomyces rubiginosohelvolus]|uniref:NAD(P)H-binding protein n=1 Tax=Streptomyces rubiginosohelvolus TaxID=67362 RepID=UPI00371252FF